MLYLSRIVKIVSKSFLRSHGKMVSQFVTKNVFQKNVAFASLSPNVAFVRNDPYATSTAGWRLIISPVACQLASPHGKHHTSRRGALYVYVYL